MDVVRCAECGEENPGRARFCLNCGSPIAQDALPSREVRKTLTILFADMVGFTSLGERLDQESLRRVMDSFYARMRDAIEGQGGTVAKFIGDAVMAVWGMPAVNEDDALRAVRAAEDMRRALATLNDDLQQRWGVRVGLRTGVNTGEVVVDPGKPADLLVGDTLNVAARLEQAAAEGEVLVGSETYRLVRDHARLEPIAPLDLKGKGRPVSAFRLLDGSAREHPVAERLRAPLVGRERELARLEAALAAATAASETRVVTLIGSPGVGKSRLVEDFAGALGETATVVTGHCEAAGEGLTFLPVAEIVRSGAGIHEGDSPESAGHKLGAVLPDDDPDREQVVERALGLVGLGPAVSVEESFWAVRRLLEGLARLRRLVVLLDDVHWGQPTFLDLIEHLATWGRGAPVLVVLMARPELREIRPALTERNESVTEVIALGPLRPGDSRALVDRLLGEADLPPELAERVLETTEGNPLFLGEMLRMLVDDGVLTRAGDRWVVPEEAERVLVPPTVQALLAARIERLSDPERSVVERAAVIGQQFYAGAVAALSPPTVGPKVAEHLDRLRRKELVTLEGTLWEGEEVFRFHHILIRDAAYRSLLKEARADLHERFADWLGERAGEHDELIALHLESAHAYRAQLGPLDERGRALAVRAAARLRAAGWRALQREDLPAAANLLVRALHPLDAADPSRLGILADLAETQLSAGDTAAAEETVDELALRAEAAGDEPLRALATAYGCQLAILTGAGHVRETIALASEAAETLEKAGDAVSQAKAHHVVAQAHSLLGEIAAAEAALDRGLVAARAAGDRRRVTAVLSGAPRAALWGPSPIVRASGRCLDVVRILRMEPGNRHVEAAALRSQAVLEAMRGRPDPARGILATCRATLEELGLELELHDLDTYAGITELLAGDPVAAERHLRAAHHGFAALGVDSGAAQASALLARALVEQGRFHEAEEQTRHAERHAGEDLKTGIVWRGVRAEALARRGEHDEAERVAREAVALAESTDALADKADALMALASVLRACDKEDDARDAATRALALYDAKGHTVGAMGARAALGIRALSPGTFGRQARTTLGDTEAERLWAAYTEAFRAADWDGVRAVVTEDVVLADHRELGWQELRGVEAFLDAQRAGAAVVPGATLRTERVVAADEGTAALVCALSSPVDASGGPAEIALGVLLLLRDSRVARVELFHAEDEDGMRARAAELGGPVVPDHWHRYVALVGARDWDGLRGMFAEDFVLADHRRIGWGEIAGVDAAIAAHRAAADLAPMTCRVDAALAVDEEAGVNAVRLVFLVEDDDAPAETAVGVLTVLRGGAIVRTEFFAPEEEHALLARYQEVRADRSRGAPRTVPPTVVARVNRWALAASEARFDDITDAPDYVFVDHRRHGSGEVTGSAPGRRVLRAVHDNALSVRFAPHTLAGLDDGTTNVVLARVTVSGVSRDGGGPFEAVFLSLTVEHEGLTNRSEMFDIEDEELALRRFDEVCAAVLDGVTLAPDAREPIPPAVVARLRGSGAEVVAGVLVEGRHAAAARVDGEHRLLTGGGTEEPRSEAFADLPALLARYEERRFELGSGGWMEALNARDYDKARGLFGEAMVVRDHRPVGWESVDDPAVFLARAEAVNGISDDAHWVGEIVELDGGEDWHAEHLVVTVSGTLESGPWEVTFRSVGTSEHGLRTRFEFFLAEDDAGARARFAELARRYSAAPCPPVMPPSPR